MTFEKRRPELLYHHEWERKEPVFRAGTPTPTPAGADAETPRGRSRRPRRLEPRRLAPAAISRRWRRAELAPATPRAGLSWAVAVAGLWLGMGWAGIRAGI